MAKLTFLLFLIVFNIKIIFGLCPYILDGTPINGMGTAPLLSDYQTALNDLDISAVFEDIYDLLTNSQECWPADTLGGTTNYGGLFIRLSWHISGTYRNNDNLGGAAGGRQRFPPESSWDDNANLDKARALLVPIKNKYGDALSWGDLMVFAGTASIKYMGGPVTSVCAGRIDDIDGTKSIPLSDPTLCGNNGNGNCDEPLGASTIGLIYVNPEGVEADSNATRSAPRIRDVFGRMGMNDEETVALIGGGHAFGKSHGACPDGPGDGPDIAPETPWLGNCGTGKGDDTYTSGLEGQWTTYPFVWDNEYFTQLINDTYTLITGPGDKKQWINERNGYLMLTTDIALIEDPEYYDIVYKFATNQTALDYAFGNVWKKLTEQGSGWVPDLYTKCVDASSLTPTQSNAYQSIFYIKIIFVVILMQFFYN